MEIKGQFHVPRCHHASAGVSIRLRPYGLPRRVEMPRSQRLSLISFGSEQKAAEQFAMKHLKGRSTRKVR